MLRFPPGGLGQSGARRAMAAVAEAWRGVGSYLAVALPSFSMILFGR